MCKCYLFFKEVFIYVIMFGRKWVDVEVVLWVSRFRGGFMSSGVAVVRRWERRSAGFRVLVLFIIGDLGAGSLLML